MLLFEIPNCRKKPVNLLLGQHKQTLDKHDIRFDENSNIFAKAKYSW